MGPFTLMIEFSPLQLSYIQMCVARMAAHDHRVDIQEEILEKVRWELICRQLGFTQEDFACLPVN